MKAKKITAIILALAVGAGAIAFTAVTLKKAPESKTISFGVGSSYANREAGSNISACYSFGANNFRELDKHTPYIARAETVSIDIRRVGQVATLKVTEVYRGEVEDEILLYQMLGDNNVEVGKEYILFMDRQYSDTGPIQAFCTVSGPLGVMGFDAQGKKITVADSCLLDRNLERWAEKNVAPSLTAQEEPQEVS